MIYSTVFETKTSGRTFVSEYYTLIHQLSLESAMVQKPDVRFPLAFGLFDS